jgi:2',3'-cyclic-nucleotide 2'-phosphodiesterase (5'-nucleotidase family)
MHSTIVVIFRKFVFRIQVLPFLIAGLLLLNSCNPSKNATGSGDDGKLDFTIVQINDVYEIAPLDGGKAGGMARVATVKKEQLKENPNTFLVMAGDFLSPSVYNSLKYEGNRIRGRQMVDAMNAAGVDLVVFGNKEIVVAE